MKPATLIAVCVVLSSQVGSPGILASQQFSARVFGGYGTTTGYGPGVGVVG